ncbi:30S ribosomal protein S6 alpha, chloroplastic [Vitis vinifera]|uniref:30S ribosomal protein S6 alpha, chloroplastic n=1 Tax=Vitis vinifera TaxID=29760 RepID=A0A438BV04_VITVI|nr:30S ribosomal protein S6 alpha, chloroplastic [Vitis vinifera]
MASPSLPSSSLLSRFSSAQSSPPITSFTVFSGKQRFIYHPRRAPGLSIRALTLDFSGSFFEGGFGSDDDPNSPPGPGIAAVEDKDEPQCPPGSANTRPWRFSGPTCRRTRDSRLRRSTRR